MDIAEVARRSGLPASTLRFYEEKGLITSYGRRGLRRLFDAHVLERLALIALGRSAGFSLDEIGRMLSTDGRPQIDRRLLADKADELDGSIRKLIAMRNGLRHAAVCSAPSHMECPTFRRLLGLAASGAIGGLQEQKPPQKRRRDKATQRASQQAAATHTHATGSQTLA
jgi:DNA-binding transcriptional MerR regulator